MGGTIGGVVGLLAAIGAFLFAKSNLPWVSASLVSDFWGYASHSSSYNLIQAALLGLFSYRTRSLIFIADENIPESQVRGE